MKEKQHRLAVVMEKLDMLSPVQVLRRGYGIVEQDEKILTSINDAAVGAHIEVRLKDGALTAVVEAIKAQKG